jgi:hypothetical protein
MIYKRHEQVGDIIFPDETLEINCAYDILDSEGVLNLLKDKDVLESCKYLIERIKG